MSDEEVIERLVFLNQRLVKEEPEEVLKQIANILQQAYEQQVMPAIRFRLLCCVLLGAERGGQLYESAHAQSIRALN